MINYLLIMVTVFGIPLLEKCLQTGEKCESNITLCCQICYENTICIDPKLNI